MNYLKQVLNWMMEVSEAMDYIISKNTGGWVEPLDRFFTWFAQHVLHCITGMLFVIIGYFDPIKGIVNVMIGAILFDMVLGIAAARKRGEGIKSKKLWRTATKMFISIGLVMLLHSADMEIKITGLYRLMAWVIVGFETWSILESAGELTENKLFNKLQTIMKDKVKDTTGVDISDKEKDDGDFI